MQQKTYPLPEIPVLETGADFPFETLATETVRAHALLDSATRGFPASALKALDAASKRWLKKYNNAHLPEITRIAQHLNRPGAYFLSVNYEWGCTCRVGPSPDNTSARLARVLDWRTPGLGRNIIAAKADGPCGAFVTLTWPGYTGVLQAMAPGRFACALNQAPMDKRTGFYVLDWAAAKKRVWSMPHTTASHLLRHVFENAHEFNAAKHMLTSTPIAAPAIFSLAGIAPHETCVIERKESLARVHEGARIAANHWQARDWHGHERGVDSAGRACQMARVSADMDAGDNAFAWLQPPIRNDRTRLAMFADAKAGRVVAQGYEADGAATAVLDLTV